MKASKKWIVGATSAALVASAIVPVASAASFSDIENNTHKDAILALAEAGIISGYTDGTFRPNAIVTRGNVVKLLGKWLVAEGYEIPTDYNTVERFTDLPTNSADQELVKFAALVKDAGVFKGSNNQLMQANNMSREQMAVVLVRALNTVYGVDLVADYKAANFESNITDLDKATADENREAIIALEYAELTTVTAFNPKNSLTRGQFASFLNRAITNVAKEELKVESVTAVNGTLTVKLAEKAEKVSVEDFKVSQAINGGTATEVTPSAAVLSEDGLTVTLTVPEVAAQETTEQSVVYTVNEVAASAFVVEASTSVVLSVNAINATQVEVKFSKPVTKSSVIAESTSGSEVAGTLVDGVFKFATLDGKTVTADSATATLSEDGKTLTITSATVFEGRYDVTIDGAKDKLNNSVAKFAKVLDFGKDTTAPTIIKTEKVSANLVKISFSEPVKSLGTVSFQLEDGSVVTGITEASAFNAGDSSVTYDLTAARVNGTDLASGVNVKATFVGVQDQNLNLLTPNPATVTFTKGTKDGVAPTVSAVTQTGAKEFTVKFSEQLIANPTIRVNGTTVDAANVVQDTTDKTKYVVTTTTVLDGATTVSVDAGYADLSGETGIAFSKVYTFVKDAIAAKATSAVVVQDTTDGKQYLEITFDKNVELGSTPQVTVKGTHVKNFVTVDVDETATVSYKTDTNKKVIRVALSTLLNNPSSAYKTGAIYNLDVTFSGITSETGIAVDSTSADFTLVADGPATASGKVTVISVEQGASNDLVKVTFDGNVDLETATTAANYTVDGAVVESATATSDTTNVITLRLKANSNTFTGIRNVTVKNVKKLDGSVAMDTQTIVSSVLNENVLPTVISAKLTAVNTIEVTFSENVASGTAADFVLYVGGEAVSTSVTTATQASATDNVLELNLGTPVTAEQLTKGLSLKAATTLDIVDSVGNKLTVPTAITVVQ